MVKKTSGYDVEYLKKLARTGAQVTLAKLRDEIAVLERTFPELTTSKGIGKMAASVQERAGRMSAAGRNAVSARMKKYWAERRKAKALEGGLVGNGGKAKKLPGARKISAKARKAISDAQKKRWAKQKSAAK
jgi:hypothetical protein